MGEGLVAADQAEAPRADILAQNRPLEEHLHAIRLHRRGRRRQLEGAWRIRGCEAGRSELHHEMCEDGRGATFYLFILICVSIFLYIFERFIYLYNKLFLMIIKYRYKKRKTREEHGSSGRA